MSDFARAFAIMGCVLLGILVGGIASIAGMAFELSIRPQHTQTARDDEAAAHAAFVAAERQFVADLANVVRSAKNHQAAKQQRDNAELLRQEEEARLDRLAREIRATVTSN